MNAKDVESHNFRGHEVKIFGVNEFSFEAEIGSYLNYSSDVPQKLIEIFVAISVSTDISHSRGTQSL